MKKTLSLFVLIAILFLPSSCKSRSDVDSLIFPKTTWGMSVEETFDAFGITKEDTASYDDYEKGGVTVFSINDYELFGEPASKIVFNFMDLKDNGNGALCEIKVIYPQSADMDHILEEMQKTYGETVPNFSVYDGYQISDQEMAEIKFSESEDLKLWASKPVTEYIPQNESEHYRNLWENYQPGLVDENWDLFSQNARMVTVNWSRNEVLNMLSFRAYNFCVYNELKSQLSKQQ